MKVSREKINHISSLIVQDFEKRDELDYSEDLNDIRLEIARVMTEKLQLEDKADQTARKIVTSYSRNLREGSPEWDVMYHKHYEEELNKLGL